MIVPYLSFLVSLHATNADVHTHMHVVRATLELTYLLSCHDVSMLVVASRMFMTGANKTARWGKAKASG